MNYAKYAFLLLILLLFGCTTTYHAPRVVNEGGKKTIYENHESPGEIQGIGIESQDIVSMTDRMMRDMMSNQSLSRSSVTPRVVIDSEYFYNESSSVLNKNSITDRLRVELNRAANGRMFFVGRHYSDMYEKERSLKRSGIVDSGTTGQAAKSAGADYRMGGRITTLDSVDPGSGMKSRYHQITFEMVELETGIIVWSGIYEFKKSSQNDIVYR